MSIEKKFPVKILDNLYVVGISNATADEKKEFLDLYETEIMDRLIVEEPSARIPKKGIFQQEFFSPSFGRYVVSNTKQILKFESKHFAKSKAEEFYVNLEYIYNTMGFCFDRLTEYINVKHGL